MSNNEAIKQTAPNATASLVLGIVGLILWWVPFVGLTLGILSLICSSKARAFVRTYPAKYAGGIATAGLVLGIIAVTLSTMSTCTFSFAGLAVEAKKRELNSKGF